MTYTPALSKYCDLIQKRVFSLHVAPPDVHHLDVQLKFIMSKFIVAVFAGGLIIRKVSFCRCCSMLENYFLISIFFGWSASELIV